MASQEDLPTRPNEESYMCVPSPLFPQVPSIIFPPAAVATTSSPNLSGVNIHSDHTETIELEVVSAIVLSLVTYI